MIANEGLWERALYWLGVREWCRESLEPSNSEAVAPGSGVGEFEPDDSAEDKSEEPADEAMDEFWAGTSAVTSDLGASGALSGVPDGGVFVLEPPSFPNC